MKSIQLVIVAFLLVQVAGAASSACPVLLVSGTGDQEGINVTFRNIANLPVPIRRMEFNCTQTRAKGGPAQRGQCSEQNASFIPKTEFTVSYPYPAGKPGPVLVSLKSVTFSDGHTFKPTKRDPCRVLKIMPPRAKK